jgi:cytochrome c5
METTVGAPLSQLPRVCVPRGPNGMRKSARVEGLVRDLCAHQRGVAYLFLALPLAWAVSTAHAQGDARSGREVFEAVCAACHATGVDGAPKIGDREAWSNRASLGLSSLTAHALEGIRNMPAHGGDPELSDLEIARAVTYMINQSGGNWVEPASVADLTIDRSGEQVVKAQCAGCHAEGVGGAPRIGDLEAWVPRFKHGLPYLVSSAIHGHGGMPPRGGQANLTDSELRSAILYMYNPAGAPAKRASGTARSSVRAGQDPNHQSVDGLEVYLGFMPAQYLRALPKDSPERAMHGGLPEGSGYYHVNVSLFDEKSRAPINDAQVQMQLDLPGLTRTSIELEPMLPGSGSYGNYVKPQLGSPYLITLNINRPGAAQTVKAKFKRKF